ncbi:putative AAA+ superfamily ATPase [Algoriphagus sp. 4150]|uniref:ATP-binding protein n=1 Tax=Algoriphagus sp. 4150 TaxID=2817756 RepID=UPI002864C920|nr:ATP-binding protein [Algoriphagus sp. 4150]MDR7129285.1 putative AAA+ superfamily ATPase [Algoriphagus sp. 4150]
MIQKHTLGEIILDQEANFLQKKLIGREETLPDYANQIVIVSGVRRCGKSILIRNRFSQDHSGLYLNFEDPRLVNFEPTDFPKLEELRNEFGKAVILLDELQWVEGWEVFARSLHEKDQPLYITGSNASMLSRELGTRLTGRYKQIELFPFSYTEFLTYKSLAPEESSFESYFQLGGFPEYLQNQDQEYLRTLMRDVLTRDVAVRRNISNETQLIRLGVFLASNIGKEFSYSKMAQLLEIKSVRTAIDYCDYLEESYLFDLIPMYSQSIRKQVANPKKAFCVDPALASANSLSFSKDLGRRLENFVYLHLRRSFQTIHYYRSKNSECDFLIKWNEEIIGAVQVCWELTPDNLEREVNGIKDAMKETGLSTGFIITYNQEDSFEGIAVVPAWKWFLSNSKHYFEN